MTVIQQDRTTNVPLGSIAASTSARAGTRIDVPVYSVTKHRGFVPSAEYFSKQVFSRELSNYKLISSGDFAYATIHLDEGSIGIAPEDALVSPMYTSFSVDHSLVDADYLVRFLKSPRALATYPSLGKGSAERRRSISFQRLSELQIPLLPLPEQRRISAILANTDHLRTQRREAVAHLNALTQSIFDEMFGDLDRNTLAWPSALLDQLLIVGPQNGMYLPSNDYGSGTPIVRIDSFRNGVVDDLATLKRLMASDSDVRRYGLNAGDVLINRVNSIEHLGKAAIVPTLREPTVFESNMMRCRFDSARINNTFMRFTLQSQQVKRQILRSAKRAVNQASINQTDVKNFLLPVPPLELQQTFARRVAVVEHLKEKHLSQLAELDTLFASLQHRAFKGEL